MELRLIRPWGLTPTHTTVYVVFDGILAGCYHSYSDAEEAFWYSDEPVRMYKTFQSAKQALTKYKKSKSKSS